MTRWRCVPCFSALWLPHTLHATLIDPPTPHQHMQAYAATVPPERALSFGPDGQVNFDMERYIRERKAAEVAGEPGKEDGVGEVTAALEGAVIDG